MYERVRSRIKSILLTAFWVAAGACGRDSGSGGATELFPASAPRATLIEELRLDGATEDFSVVRTVAVGPGGDIAITFPQDRQVWIYDAAGRLLAKAGREGSGPGEFRQLSTAGWVDGKVWVFDRSNNRVTQMDRTGSLLEEHRPTGSTTIALEDGSTATLLFFIAGALRSDGTMIGEGRYQDSGSGGLSGSIIAAVSGSDEARLIFRPPAFEDRRWYIEVDGFGSFVPFAMTPRTTISPDGSTISSIFADETARDGGTVLLTSIHAEGDTIFSRRYEFVGIPITPGERDSALAAIIPDRPPTEGPPDLFVRRQAIARERLPAVHSPVNRMQIGLDGTIWIELAHRGPGLLTLVLDPEGTPIGTVLFPEGSRLRAATASRAWVTQYDPDGLASVVRYRLEGLPQVR